MVNLTLYGESSWVSPWVFHAMVALAEKQLPYRLELVPLPIPPAQRVEFEAHAVLGRVPMLVHGDVWISESLAISEYLAETYPTPAHPRLFPADLALRARARQIMSMLRTSLFALRHDRPTSTIFGPLRPRATTAAAPLSVEGAADAAELLRIAGRLVQPGALSMFAQWCIADADLGLALMRLVGNDDPVPAHLATYAQAQWARPSAQTYLQRVATHPPR
jgi:glutathione S-transferase